ncbi:hypothetical protein Tco_0273165 [Tanacetum coccineum]
MNHTRRGKFANSANHGSRISTERSPYLTSQEENFIISLGSLTCSYGFFQSGQIIGCEVLAPLVSDNFEVKFLEGGEPSGAISPRHAFFAKRHLRATGPSTIGAITRLEPSVSLFSMFGKLEAFIGKAEWSILLKEDGSTGRDIF